MKALRRRLPILSRQESEVRRGNAASTDATVIPEVYEAQVEPPPIGLKVLEEGTDAVVE
jgi:hypothetical protein